MPKPSDEIAGRADYLERSNPAPAIRMAPKANAIPTIRIVPDNPFQPVGRRSAEPPISNEIPSAAKAEDMSPSVQNREARIRKHPANSWSHLMGRTGEKVFNSSNPYSFAGTPPG